MKISTLRLWPNTFSSSCLFGRVQKGLRFMECRVLQDIEAVHSDECPSQVSPLSGDGVFHFIQGQVQILDHVSVAVTVTQTPGVQKVIGRLPHGLEKTKLYYLIRFIRIMTYNNIPPKYSNVLKLLHQFHWWSI